MIDIRSDWRGSAIVRFTIVAAANLAAAGSGLLFLSLVARTTGAEGLGQMALVFALLLFGQSVSNFGSDSIGIQVVAAEPERAAQMVATIMAFRLLMCLPVVAAVGALLLLAPSFIASPDLLLILSVSLLMNACTPLWVAQAFERSGVAALVNAGAPLLSLSLSLLLVTLWPRLEMFATTRVVAELIVGAVLVAAVAFTIGIGPAPRWTDIRALAKASNPVGWSKLVINGGLASDLVLVGLFVPATSLGYYAASGRVYAVGLLMTVLYSSIIMPSLARLAYAGPAAFRTAVLKSLRLIIPLGAIAAIVVAITAPIVLRLAFGPSFQAGGAVLQVLCIAALVNLASKTCSVSLIAGGHAYVEMRSTLAVTLAGLALKAALAASYGIVGGAMATLITEMMLLILQGRSLWRLTRGDTVQRDI